MGPFMGTTVSTRGLQELCCLGSFCFCSLLGQYTRNLDLAAGASLPAGLPGEVMRVGLGEPVTPVSKYGSFVGALVWYMAVSLNLGASLGVLIIRALLFGVYTR